MRCERKGVFDEEMTSTALYCAVFYCALMSLVDCVEAVYGDPDNFVLAHNENGGAYMRGYALDWMVRSVILELYILGLSARAGGDSLFLP